MRERGGSVSRHEPAAPGAPFDQERIDRYRRDGFLVVENVFEEAALAELRGAVEAAVAAESTHREPESLSRYERIFDQKVNLWTRHPDVAVHARAAALGDMAAALEGCRMRIWHDQALFKAPHLADNRTPWHQDAVYWPHHDRWHATTIWIALEDATIESGCMSFVPGSQGLGPLEPVALKNPADIFAQAPGLRDVTPVPCPLRAGSVTFHNGLTWHCAGANRSEATRKAYAIIFMPDGTRYTGASHVLTDAMALDTGVPLAGSVFPSAG